MPRLEGPTRDRDSVVDILRVAVRNLGDHPSVNRRHPRRIFAGGGCDAAAIDEARDSQAALVFAVNHGALWSRTGTGVQQGLSFNEVGARGHEIFKMRRCFRVMPLRVERHAA